MVRHGKLVEHVLHIRCDSIGVAAESVNYSPQGIVAVGPLTESVINTDISGPCGGVKHYSGLAFLFDGELRYPVGKTIIVKFVVGWYGLKPGMFPINVLGKFFQSFLEKLWFFVPHSFKGIGSTLKGNIPVEGEGRVGVGEWQRKLDHTIATNPCTIQDVFEETKLVLGISRKLVLFPSLDGRG